MADSAARSLGRAAGLERPRRRSVSAAVAGGSAATAAVAAAASSMTAPSFALSRGVAAATPGGLHRLHRVLHPLAGVREDISGLGLGALQRRDRQLRGGYRGTSSLTRHAAPFMAGAVACGTAGALRGRPSKVAVGQSRSDTSAAFVQAALATPPFSGEWAFRASVLGNLGALSGHVYLDPSGKAAYVSDGVQIVGRGTGRWVTSGNAAAVELDIYQYGAAATNIPEHPHRFIGLWQLSGDGTTPMQGDWYMVPDGEAPRLVGTFDVAATTVELLPAVLRSTQSAVPGGTPSSPMCPDHLRDALLAALHAAEPLPPLASTWMERLEPYRVGRIPTVHYIPDWIDATQERELMHHADVELNGWEQMKTRSSQEWGAGDKCVCGRGLRREKLPPTQQRIADALHYLGVFDGAMYPMNSVRLNAYVPGQGIEPHCDGPVYYPRVGILSLASPCVLSFYPRSGTEDCMKWDADNDVPGGHQKGDTPLESVFLEPRSLLLFGKDAFWHHRHGIDAVASEELSQKVCNYHLIDSKFKQGDVVQRGRRVSLTMRHLLPRCACQG
eukprot:TRINITY_DN100949_c0_g1_i1.p1 TRINITY_DN100949_c0_g1~~TRINITY_DN100949_c0_g1_i1.p1  ORF type:complete len:571 (-),score=99.35 TRINITY_DN100949_c0_g1_i1:69-1739(-)